MRISDWSSDVCSSDLRPAVAARGSGRWCRLLRRRFRRVPVAAVLSGRVKEYRPHQALTRNSADTEIRIRAFAQPRFCSTPLPRLRCRPATTVDFPARICTNLALALSAAVAPPVLAHEQPRQTTTANPRQSTHTYSPRSQTVK